MSKTSIKPKTIVNIKTVPKECLPDIEFKKNDEVE